MRIVLLILFLVSLMQKAEINAAEVDWPSVSFTLVATNLSLPTHITHAGDGSGRLFVTEQAGKIQVITNGVVQSTPFLDITPRVGLYYERGLLSLAFSPGFKTNRQFYICYVREPDAAVTISRFLAPSNSPTADPTSEQQILVVPHPNANHNGGQLAFGPDGFLYISIGDGGSNASGDDYHPENSQNSSNLLGKILRIDVSSTTNGYVIPASNPFVTNSAFRPEIWATGLRNPWRFSFDRLTGDLYIGDVGSMFREEIDFQPANSGGGQNYGWPMREGAMANPYSPITNSALLTEPVADIPWDDGSITGGYVVRSADAGRLGGVYVFANFSYSGNTKIFGLARSGTNWQAAILTDDNAPLMAVSTFGEDEIGNLYVADYWNGGISRINDSNKARRPEFDLPDFQSVYYHELVGVYSSSPGSVLHYTKDGRVPTTSDPFVISGQQITITNGMTIKARAFRADLSPSDIVETTFQLHVAPLRFSPSNSPIADPTFLTIDSDTSYAKIHYTLDGTLPTTNSLTYDGAILMHGNVTLKAQAFATGHVSSPVHSMFYGLRDFESTVVTTIAGTGEQGFHNGPGLSAEFDSPWGIAVDSNGVVYVSDFGSHSIRKIFPSGEVITFIGSGQAGPRDGVGTNADLSYPTGICLDQSGNLYVSDPGNHAIRRVTQFGQVTTLATNLGFGLLNLDINSANNIYQVHDFNGGILYRVLPSGSKSDFFSIPFEHMQGVAIDPLDNIFVTTWYYDGGIHYLYKVLPSGSGQLIAGGKNAYSDGPPSQAAFQGINDLASDVSGNIYIAEGSCVRKFSTNNWFSTLAGSIEPGFQSGPGDSARFDTILGICVDSLGSVYVCDRGNYRIRKIWRDSDSDAIPDLQEGGDTPFVVGSDDRTIDSDGDGQTNADEYTTGTNPLSASSRFKIKEANRTGSNLTISWDAGANRMYQLSSSSNLTSWTIVTNIPNAVAGTASYTVTNAGSSSTNVFYRLGAWIP